MTLPSLDGCAVLPPLEPTATGKHTPRPPKPPSKSSGRFQLLNTFIDFGLKDLSRNEIAVWLILYRDSKEGVARTGQRDIARRSGISDRTVRRVIDQLQQKGFLIVVRRGRINAGPSSYRVRPLAKENP